MAFQYAYTLDGGDSPNVKDLPLDTLGNYGTGGQKKGDLVLQSSGLLRRVGTAGGAGVGVLEAGEFTGLVAQGQPYAATNTAQIASVVDTTRYPNGMGKVRSDKACVYKVPVYQGGATQTATNAHLSNSYAIQTNGTTGDQSVDLNVTATPSVKILDRTADGKFVFVTLV